MYVIIYFHKVMFASFVLNAGPTDSPTRRLITFSFDRDRPRAPRVLSPCN